MTVTRGGDCKVSIIITAHNYGEYLPQCLDSAVNQTYPAENYEVVVVNDGSTDDTADILRDYRFEYPDLIRTLELDGKGLPAACNEGIEAANGEYIIRLDADDFFDENILTVETHYLDAHPEIDLVYPDYYRIDDDGDILDHVRNPEVGEEVKLLNRSPLAAGAMYKRSAWTDLGGYDESLDHQEDYDFWIRFSAGRAIHNINLPLMYYRRHGDNMSNNLSGRLDARNEVKKTFVENKLADELADTEVLCIVPARNEQRIEFPDGVGETTPLALQDLHDRSLLSYTVHEAMAADRIDRTIVSTEDETIATEARDLGADVPTIRPSSLSESTVTLDEVVSHHVSRLDREEDYHPDLIVLNQYVSPLKTAEHIDALIDTWLMFSVDSVISVTGTKRFFWQPGKYGLSPLFEDRLLREERETLYRENGALYAFSPDVLHAKQDIIGDYVGHLRMEQQHSVHIDTWFDLKLCEHLLATDGSRMRPMYRSAALDSDN